MSGRRFLKRDIALEGHVLDGGRLLLTGRLADRLDRPFRNHWRGTVSPGEALHEMEIHLVIDREAKVEAIEVTTLASPYPAICATIAPAYQALIGKSIGQGWRRNVAAAVGGTRGCTHLSELLGLFGTAAYLTFFLDGKADRDASGARPEQAPEFIDTCHALTAAGEVIRTEYPEYSV